MKLFTPDSLIVSALLMVAIIAALGLFFYLIGSH